MRWLLPADVRGDIVLARLCRGAAPLGELEAERMAVGRGSLAKQANQRAEKENRCKSQAPLPLYAV